ncbi:cytochrome b5 [Fomitiporia mediterranea MF3/22]|uniref:cytochrome b5 n=1 Tax=Fomitiporia mediterranea (strain MF3/22) TaxID=694068 RepID=UPI0004407D8F|nr:cytochrome b5 [Fomitiporia mediterranea MF3/22]EJD01291.1 cytochrome b5 [Fomitiporia mediterranea MF3/22]
MSWLFNPTGEHPPRAEAQQPEEEMAEDYSGRKVSTRTANQPFLAYTRYRQEQKRLHEEWLERKKQREEKIARGEEVGPEEKDPTAQEEVGLLGLLKFIVYCLLFLALVGKFFTGSFLFDYEAKLPALKKLWPTNDRLFSEEGLSKFDGTDKTKPIYLAIDGIVYDVTEGRRTYGPGGSYNFMAGHDAARAFATGCFATHRTHDIRGLSERELKARPHTCLEHWKNFFANHKKYFKVGRVLHHPIDPLSPIPEPCKEEKPKAGNNEKPKDEGGSTKSDTRSAHTEL